MNQKIVTDQLGKSEKDNESDEAQSIEPQDQPIESGTGAATTSTELPKEWRFLGIYHWTISLVKYRRV